MRTPVDENIGYDAHGKHYEYLAVFVPCNTLLYGASRLQATSSLQGNCCDLITSPRSTPQPEALHIRRFDHGNTEESVLDFVYPRLVSLPYLVTFRSL